MKPKVDLTNQTTLLNASLREHSRKLDHYSREARPGWEQYGDEPSKFEGAA